MICFLIFMLWLEFDDDNRWVLLLKLLQSLSDVNDAARWQRWTTKHTNTQLCLTRLLLCSFCWSNATDNWQKVVTGQMHATNSAECNAKHRHQWGAVTCRSHPLSHSQLISDGRDVTPPTSVRKAVSYLDWTEQHLMYIWYNINKDSLSNQSYDWRVQPKRQTKLK